MSAFKGKGLTSYQLKLLAMLAMVSDHLSHMIPVHSLPVLALAVTMNSIGRLTMPIMCFFIAEGYHHTKNLKRYFLRLFIFAVISQIPFYIYSLDAIPQNLWEFILGNLHLNVMYTLFMGLLALTIAKSEKLHLLAKVPLVMATVILTHLSDWRIYGVLWVLIFGLFRGDFKKQALFFIATILLIAADSFLLGNFLDGSVKLFALLSLPLLWLYNGQQGKKIKYGFYIFYPAHLLVLGIIKIFMPI